MIYFINKPYKQLLIGFTFLLFVTNIIAQHNFVPNYSFEQYTVCPDGTVNEKPDIWYKPDKGGAGYFNGCASSNKSGVPIHLIGGGYDFQFALTGSAYIGMIYLNSPNTNSRNYFQVELSDSLKAGKWYYAEYFVNLSDLSRLACNNQSMLFTNTDVYVDTNAVPYIKILPANPQITNYSNPIITDTLKWIKISGVFIANGGEQYLTLGNFKYDSLTLYKQIQTMGNYGAAYYVDDVSVFDLDSFHLQADAGRDTTITKGDSVFIGSYTNGIDTIKWLQNGITVIDTVRPGFWVWPTANTFYVLTQTVGGYTSSDTVYIGVQTPTPVSITNYQLRITGEKEVVNSWHTATELNTNYFIVQHSIDGKNFTEIGIVKAIGSGANSYQFVDDNPANGVNYYRLKSVDKDGSFSHSKVVSVQLTVDRLPFTVVPNPARDVVTINGNHIASVQVMDIMGRVVNVITLKDATNPTLSVSSLPAGVYQLRVQTTDGTVSGVGMVKE